MRGGLDCHSAERRLAMTGDAVFALAPTGTLRFGVVEAPSAGAFFVGRDGSGAPFGVTVDLARGLAASVGVDVAFTVFPNSGECTEAIHAGDVDAGFMPVDAHRASRVLFGAGYYDLESTYGVTGASGITDMAEVDRPGVRVAGIADTTTIRAAGRSLRHVVPEAIRGVDEAVARLRAGTIDALAVSRDSLNQICAGIPGARVLVGAFQTTVIAVAVPPGREAGLGVASAWLEGAKRDGTVRRAFDAVGLEGETVSA